MHNLFDNITANDIRDQILQIRSLDLRNAETQEVTSRIKRLITGYECSDQLHLVNPIKQTYRARINKEKHLFTKVADLIYPQKDKIGTYGRLNGVNESMFYIFVVRHGSY